VPQEDPEQLLFAPPWDVVPKQYAIKMFYYFIEYHRAKLNTLASTLSSWVAGYALSVFFRG
jgi:hypothetical protein